MKIDYVALLATVSLILFAIITYFGRIYFPENFHPETVPFIENYWVMVLGFCFIGGILSISVFGLYWMGTELVKDIKSIYDKFTNHGSK